MVRKHNFFVPAVIFILVFVLMININHEVFASLGAKVFVRIESADETLARGYIYAYTFGEALQKLGDESNIDIIFKQKNQKKELYQVNDTKNEPENYVNISFNGWHCYLVRGNLILEPENILDELLKSNDEVVLYYGNPDITEKIASINKRVLNNKVSASLESTYVSWVNEYDTWKAKNFVKDISGAKVHLTILNGDETVLATNDAGYVQFTVDQPGIYEMYAENYSKPVPLLVRTKTQKFAAGFMDDNAITRGEFVAAIVNSKLVEPLESNMKFIDVTDNTPFKNQIHIATARGLISGYSDGTFRPSNKITLLETCIILYNQYSSFFHSKSQTSQSPNLSSVPKWAYTIIDAVINNGILNNVELNFSKPLSTESFNLILNNLTFTTSSTDDNENLNFKHVN